MHLISMARLGYRKTAVQTQTGAMLGTPYYMSPEQAAGKKDVDHRTDIWSFGVIACECLTGRRMFDADSLGGLVLAICSDALPAPSQLGPVPPAFDAWFARCVARDRQARFQTVREAAAALEVVCRSGADGTSPHSVGPLVQGAAEARTSPAEWQAQTGMTGSTQAGPTSVTVTQLTKPNRKRLLWLGVVGGLALLGTGLFFVAGRSATVAAPSNSVAAPALETGAHTQDKLSPAGEPTTSAAPEPAITPAPVASTAEPPALVPRPVALSNKPAAKIPTPKNQPRPSVTAASPAPTPVPAPAPRNPPRANPVDLAF